MQDAEIVRLILAENPDGLEAAVTKYQRELFKMAFSMSRNKQDADDLVQDTFLQLWDKASSVSDPEKLRYWLRRVLVNKQKDLWKKKKPEALNEEMISSLESNDVENFNDRQQLLWAIAQLNESQQVIVKLHYFSQMKLREISDSLGKSESTIKTHLYRAVEKLSKILQEKEVQK